MTDRCTDDRPLSAAPSADQPPAPLRLFTFRYWDDAHRQWQTLDTGAVTRDDALRRARSYLQPRADFAAGCGYRIAIPEDPSDMTLVMPREERTGTTTDLTPTLSKGTSA